MQDFRKLRVWQAARVATPLVYRVTAQFPSEERYGLVLQMRSAAISISSNIAEEAGRSTLKDSKRCMHIAYGSVCELLSQILVSSDLGFLDDAAAETLYKSIE